MFIEATPEDEATGALADYYAQQRAAWGFLPNYAAAFASRPAVADAWSALSTAIRGGMDRRRYEIATIAAARARRSSYCTAAHSMFLRDLCGDEASMRAIAEDPTGATLTDQDRAVFAFATKVALDPSSIEQDDVDAVRAAGLDDTDVADVVQAVAARVYFTTVLDALGATLDPQTADRFDPDLRAAMIVGRPVREP